MPLDVQAWKDFLSAVDDPPADEADVNTVAELFVAAKIPDVNQLEGLDAADLFVSDKAPGAAQAVARGLVRRARAEKN